MKPNNYIIYEIPKTLPSYKRIIGFNRKRYFSGVITIATEHKYNNIIIPIYI